MARKKNTSLPTGVEITAPVSDEFATILTTDALEFLAALQREFNHRRKHLLNIRQERQEAIDGGRMPDFLESTANIRYDDNWFVAPIPAELQRRLVEITGPVERKMMINALNSGADVFMADCEDANSPTWENIIAGQINLRDAVDHTISFVNEKGKSYQLNKEVATLFVRPRGWHLEEKHILVDGQPMSGSLTDFGLYLFHNAENLMSRGSGPYFYLAKLESHLEARLWNDVFNMAQDYLDIPYGTIRVTVLIETIMAAFEMDEILFSLRPHIVALNAGRWDYIFSVIKKFRKLPGFLLPDRQHIGMTVPFMRAYTDLLVKTCHKRGAHAIGGMAAFIPSRRDEEINRIAMAKVKEDKDREANDGFDGTWVAHPDLVPLARKCFEKVLKENPHQKHILREESYIRAGDLLNFEIAEGTISEDGVRLNINVGILYIASWLQGVGAAALYNLMEDAATAEISRAQLWQWVNHPEAALPDGHKVNLDLVRKMIPEEMSAIRKLVGEKSFKSGRYQEAAKLLDELVSAESFPEFLTLGAYELLD